MYDSLLQFKYIIAYQYAYIEYAIQLIYQIFQYSLEAGTDVQSRKVLKSYPEEKCLLRKWVKNIHNSCDFDDRSNSWRKITMTPHKFECQK